MKIPGCFFKNGRFPFQLLLFGALLFLFAGCASSKNQVKKPSDFPDKSGEITVREHWPKTHKVQPGENLWKISNQYYGTGKHWRIIYNENVEKCEDPKGIRAGIELTIPELSSAQNRSGPK